MNTETAPLQGERLSWQIVCAIDAIDEVGYDHAFLTTLYELALVKEGSMDEDLLRLLAAYLDTKPRERIDQATDSLMKVVRLLSDRH